MRPPSEYFLIMVWTRHSVSTGGFLEPPPKNTSYSTLSRRMLSSSRFSSSSTVTITSPGGQTTGSSGCSGRTYCHYISQKSSSTFASYRLQWSSSNDLHHCKDYEPPKSRRKKPSTMELFVITKPLAQHRVACNLQLVAGG